MALPKMKKISNKDRIFIECYLISFNAYQAAKEAGFSEHVCKTRAFLWVREDGDKPLVAREIEERLQERLKKYEVTGEKVIAELASIAFSDIRDVMKYDSRSMKLIESSKLSPQAAAIISEVRHLDSKTKGKRTTIKLHNKVEALEKLCKHLGLYEKDNQQKTDLTLTLRDLLNEIDGETAGLPSAQGKAGQ